MQWNRGDRYASGVTEELTHYRRHPTQPGVDLLSARFVTHRFSRHTHATYTLALIESGVEEFEHGRSLLHAVAGQLALLDPEVAHSGHAGVPEGWRYRVVYPTVDVVRDVAAEFGIGGTPHFPDTVVDDPVAARLMRSVHAGAAWGDALAASSALRTALAAIVQRHAAPAPRAARGVAPPVDAARALLHERLTDPPSLEEFADAVGAGPFAMLRAFRDTYGLPPHAYLTNLRVQRAREMLDAGLRPAEVAARAGFSDQPHLTRHFKRIVGVYVLGRAR